MDIEHLSIETERLRLVPISMEYAEEIFSIFDDDVTRYMYPSTPEKIQDTEAFIQKSIKDAAAETDYTVAILKKDTGEFLGSGGIHGIVTSTPKLGIWIKKSAHGHGYGREAITGLKEWADGNLSYEYLLYPVAEENIASRKIPESLGGKEMGKQKHTKSNGVVLNMIDYHIYPTNRV